MEPRRVGVAVITGIGGWRAQDVRTTAREAEEHGFDAIFTTEANSDTMTTAQVMGCATSRIQVGTWIANIYLRHPFTCAKGAELIADDTGGRFILGLGFSHRPWNDALGIDMSNAAEDLPRYVRAVRSWLAGEGSNTYLPHGPAPVRVPVYVAALSMAAVERAAVIADGIMATMWPPERVAQAAEAIERGRARAPGLGDLDVTVGLPTFLGDDLDALHDAARGYLGAYTTFPFYQRLWRESGFDVEVDRMEQGVGPAALSDRMLDSFCLIGPVSRCRERLAAYREAGVDMPILTPGIGPAAALDVIRAFEPAPQPSRR
jgi:alkanesulfonate monooxygenase SsuD/methylene tetrahydromethanopterin reductase-like flavin-dependent oxidoreductase (luciferase family)